MQWGWEKQERQTSWHLAPGGGHEWSGQCSAVQCSVRFEGQSRRRLADQVKDWNRTTGLIGSVVIAVRSDRIGLELERIGSQLRHARRLALSASSSGPDPLLKQPDWTREAME
jgi:hypothetical protein